MKSNNRPPLRIFRYAAEFSVLLACAALVAAVVVAAWLSYRDHGASEREFALQHADDMALVLQTYTRDTLLSVDDAVRRLKRDFERDGLKTDLAQIIQDHRDIADYITLMSVADNRGQLIHSTRNIQPGTSIADLAHFSAHVDADTGTSFINKPVLGRASGKWSFHVSRRINNPDGSFGGVAIVAVDLSYWERLLREGHFGEASAIALIGRDGAARAVFKREGTGPALMQQKWEFLTGAVDGHAEYGRVALTGPDGMTATWAYRAMKAFPLLVAVSVNENVVASRLSGARTWQFGGAVAIVLLVCIFTAALMFFFMRQRRHVSETARIVQAWRQSEERFRSVFDQAAVGMGLRLVGRRDLPWQKVNRKLCDFLGYTEKELLMQPRDAINVPEDAGFMSNMDRRLNEEEVESYSREKQFLRKDGSRVWGQVTVTVLHYLDGQPAQVLSIVQDINDRKRAETAMLESEERYRRLFDASPLPALIRDENTLAILAVNQTMVDKYGYSREELAGMTVLQLQSTSARDAVRRELDEQHRGESYKIRRTHVTRDGVEMEVEITARPIEFNGRVARLVVINDVTAQVASQQAVRESEERLRTIADHLEEGLALYDSNDCLVFFNESYRRLQADVSPQIRLGMSFESLSRDRGRAMLAMGEIDDVDAFVRERMARHRSNIPGVIERKRPDGGYHLIREARTAAGQTIISYVDITDLKRRESELRDSEQRFRAMLDYAGIGITMRPTYDRELPWEVVNDRFCEMTGYSREELLRMNTTDITAADSQEAAIRDNQLMREGRIASYAREKRIIRKDGRPLWVQISVAVLPDAQGRPDRLIATYQDIDARKLAENRLRDSEAWFRAMFDHAGIGISMRPAHDRHAPWLAVNDKFCEMTGYRREELLRMSTADITPDAGQADAISDNQRLLAGEVSNYAREKLLLCKDGSRLWVAVSEALLPGATDKADRFITTYQDINARLQAEERLRESEGRLRAIIAAEPECVAIVAPDGRLLDMNPAGLRMLEAASLREMQGRPFLKQVAPGFRRAFVRLQHRILAGESGVLEFEAIGMAGKHRWLEIHGAPLYDASGAIAALLGIARDVTGRRLARDALAAERNLLRTVIDNLPDRIRVKGHDLKYTLANEAWMQARVPEHKDIVGLTNYDLMPYEAAARFEEEDRQVLDTGRPSLPREVTDGTPEDPRWFITTKMPLRDHAGSVVGIVAISRDVTDFKRRSLEVEKLNAALEARVAERTAQLTSANEELEAFASSVSHDLRAPLRHIDGMAAALLEDYPDKLDATGQGYLKRIRAAALRMAGLIEDLLRLSQVMRAELKESDVDLSALAREIADELRRDQPPRKVTFLIKPGVRVKGDAGLLRAALMNLLQNAWKFTGKKDTARIEFGAQQRDDLTVYFVQDDGAGFDMTQVDRLFDAFQRLHSARDFPGTGIGLATVRRIVRRHGGDAWAEAEVGKGATFFFTLGSRPAARVTAVPQAMSERRVHMGRRASDVQRITVMLVDDEPDVLILSMRALRPDGYEVLTAGTGEAALAMLHKQAVNVIVSDFSMPGMHGAQFLAQAAALQPDTLRLIVSGQTTNRAMQEGLQNGEIHHYFEKRHDYGAVRACIREWLTARLEK